MTAYLTPLAQEAIHERVEIIEAASERIAVLRRMVEASAETSQNAS